MKLIGSKTEQEIREQLLKSNLALFKSTEKKRLLEAIRSSFPEMKSAYIIHWIPEQGEDIYRILINDTIVAVIELERNNECAEPIITSLGIAQYLQGLSKQNQIKLAVALDLAKQELKN